MKPQTFGRNFDAGRVVPVRCIREDLLKDLEIKDSCFLMVIIREGTACFKVREDTFEAVGPCFVCFDETDSPKLVRKRGLKCDSIYFHPTFLNISMTFSTIHSESYKQFADQHDMFLLKPFTDQERHVFPFFDEHMKSIEKLFLKLDKELSVQPDWYWTCRSRSYFIEMMLLLERTYGFVEHNDSSVSVNKIQNSHLKKAIIYIESNYYDSLSLENIVQAAALNHSSLTLLFKKEFNMTPIEYLWHHRLVIAKKFLEFTDLHVKDIALRCGFKTTQHFCRKFEETFGNTPAAFRTDAVTNRKKSFENI